MYMNDFVSILSQYSIPLLKKPWNVIAIKYNLRNLFKKNLKKPSKNTY